LSSFSFISLIFYSGMPWPYIISLFSLSYISVFFYSFFYPFAYFDFSNDYDDSSKSS